MPVKTGTLNMNISKENLLLNIIKKIILKSKLSILSVSILYLCFTKNIKKISYYLQYLNEKIATLALFDDNLTEESKYNTKTSKIIEEKPWKKNHFQIMF